MSTMAMRLDLFFLLFDDPKEVYDLLISPQDAEASCAQLRKLNDIILTGRRRKVLNWDWKVLCAYIVSFETWFKSLQVDFPEIRMNIDEEIFNSSIDAIVIEDGKSVIDRDIAKDLGLWSLKLKGKENSILPIQG